MINAKILIVQDGSITSTLTSRVEALGFRGVVSVDYSVDGINAIVTNNPDIILIDVISSDQLNGLNLAVQILTTLHYPFICLIPFDLQEPVQSKSILSTRDYLVKPFEDEQLHLLIIEHLEQLSKKDAEVGAAAPPSGEVKFGLSVTDYAKHLLRYRQLVQLRTDDLVRANEQLRNEIKERKRLEDQLMRYAQNQASLVDVTSVASAFLERDSILSKILTVVMSISGIQADAGWVLFEENEPTRVIRLGPVEGIPKGIINCDHPINICSCPVCAAWLQGTNFEAIPDAYDNLHLDLDLIHSAGIVSHITIPLSVSNRLLGTITLGWRSNREPLLIERPLLISIGRQVGLALRNAQLYQSAMKLNRLEAINAISEAAGSTLQLDDVLKQIIEKACKTLNAESGAILLYSSATRDLSFAYCSPGFEKVQRNFRIQAEQGIIGWVIQYRQVALINDIQRDPRTYRGLEPVFGPGINSLICAPLIHRDQLTGVIAIFNKHEHEFNQEDADLLKAVSSICASALDNARLYQDLKQSFLEKERTQAQLIQSEKIAALGRLAASVAHEINNPLQAIQGCLSLLNEELSEKMRPEKVFNYLAIVDEEIERVVGIVRGMRDFARPAAQVSEPTNIITVLDEVLQLSHKELENRRITLDRNSEPDIPLVQANPSLLKQVFLNLILNSIDAMEGGGTLNISVKLEDIPAGSQNLSQPAVRVDFSDTGHGMSSEVMERIFEPFFTTKEKGVGLGLYITYSIIQSLNGDIKVKSTVGVGSTFTLIMPILYSGKLRRSS